MADIVIAKPGVDARVVTLAEKIQAAQAPEITDMTGWLRPGGQPLPSDRSNEELSSGKCAKVLSLAKSIVASPKKPASDRTFSKSPVSDSNRRPPLYKSETELNEGGESGENPL
jgi:uncharacterized protein (DUF305 family)